MRKNEMSVVKMKYINTKEMARRMAKMSINKHGIKLLITRTQHIPCIYFWLSCHFGMCLLL